MNQPDLAPGVWPADHMERVHYRAAKIVCGMRTHSKTGALEPAARALGRLWNFNRSLGMLFSLLVCMALSMFVNDTPVLVLALPSIWLHGFAVLVACIPLWTQRSRPPKGTASRG